MNDDEITLEQAAKLALADGAISVPFLVPEITGLPFGVDDEQARLLNTAAEREVLRPANQPGVEATATLEAMLAAGRAGKTVRG